MGSKVKDVIPNLVKRKIQTYQTMEATGMLSPQAAKDYERMKKLYPSMFN